MDENLKSIDERLRKIEERLTRLEHGDEVEKKISTLTSNTNAVQNEGSGGGWGILFLIGAGLIGLNLISKLFSYGLSSRSGYYYSSYSLFNFSNLIWLVIAIALAYFGFKSLTRKRDVKKQAGVNLATVSTGQKSQVAQGSGLNLKPEESSNLEFKIASNWFPVVGIVAIIFGVVFFLKFAFDNGWIGPTGQVTLGIIAGIVLLGLGEFFRGKYHQYSQIITGGGVVILYLSIWAAYSLFKLIGVEVTLMAMALITGTSTLLAIRYDAIGIAALGFLGGFATPLMLSSGFGTFLAMMIYVLIWDVGVLSISLFKKWQTLNLFAFLLTYFDYMVWYGGNYSRGDFGVVFFFLTLIFVIFGTITFIYGVLNDKKIEDSDVALMAINALVYFGAGMHLIHPLYRNTEGFFALIMSFVYFLLGYFSFKKYSKDANLTMAFLGLSIAFLTVAIPLQVDGTAITVAWASEAAMLVYLGFFIGSLKLRAAGLLIFILVAIRLVAFESSVSAAQFQLIANKRFLIYMFCAGSIAVAGWFYRQFSKLVTEDEKPVMAALLIAFNVVVLAAISMESNSYFEKKILESNRPTVNVLGVQNAEIPISSFSDDVSIGCSVLDANFIYLGLDNGCQPSEKISSRLVYKMAIDKLSKINSARLFVVSAGNFDEGRDSFKITVRDATLGVIDYSVDAPLTQTVNWVNLGKWDQNAIYATPELSQAFQTVVNGTNWRDPGVVVVSIDSLNALNTRKIYSYESNPANAAKLLVVYETTDNVNETIVASPTTYNYSSSGQSPYPSSRPSSYSNPYATSKVKNTNLESARDVTLSIIWILYAIALIVAGLAFKYKPIRLAAIALFSVSVLKVFLFDSRYLDTFYRIIAFMVLGTILLTVSLIYRKFKSKIEEFLL